MALGAPSYSRLATRRLVRALAHGRVDDALEALDRQADPNVRMAAQLHPQGPRLDFPVLFVALTLRNTALIETLLEAKASVDERVRDLGQVNIQGWTVLDAVGRQEDLIRLLQAGLMWHQPCGNAYRDVALHVAAAQGWPEAVVWLVRRGASVDVRNGQGQTPLHAAVREPVAPNTRARRQATVRQLARMGSSLECVDHHGFTPAQTALWHCPDLLPVLVECGARSPEREGHEHLYEALPDRVQQRLVTAASFRRLRQQLDQRSTLR